MCKPVPAEPPRAAGIEESCPLAGATGAGGPGLPLPVWDVPGSCCTERLEEGL